MRRLFFLAVTVTLGLGAAGIWLSGLAPAARAASDGGAPEVSALSQGSEIDPTRLHPQLLKSIETAIPGQTLPIIVEMRRSETLITDLVAGLAGVAARGALVAGLQAEAAVRAQPVLDVVAEWGGAPDLRVFWAAPVVRLSAGPELVAALSRLPEVVQIRPDEQFRIAEFDVELVEPEGFLDPESGLPWNLTLIRLDLVQPGLGLDGTGVIVANLDTGVDWTHPALQAKYRGYNPLSPPDHSGSWHVSTNEIYPAPGDVYGHGTHTMGTMVGETVEGVRTGVAPGAKWIAVKVISDQGIFYESWIHDAFEWILAPDGDPALAPDIVNGSWGTGLSADPRFRPDVQALRAAGILPVFSAGNSGPFESTIRSPADYPEALAVGAVDDIALVTTFSGRGPSLAPWSEIKPELAAPGVDVVSSIPGGGYFAADGTSMSAPHVAGVAALLLQAEPALSPDGLEQLLLETASPLGAPGPDNDTGWGLVDAYTAALAVVPHGRITGQALSTSGQPVPYPTVAAALVPGGPVTILSGDAEGGFDIPLAPGVYDLTVEAFGYAPGNIPSIAIQAGTLFEADVSLTQLPHGTVFGIVLDAEIGAGVPAELVVVGTGFTAQAGSDGSFAFSLPGGTWEIEVRSAAHRIGAFAAAVTPGQSTFHQITLDPAPAILLVDSGRWYYTSRIDYFRSALDELGYVYALHDIRDPYGVLAGVSDIPTADQLALYDLVIWSSPLDSPGLVAAGDVISGFLGLGGALLVSGQDAAYWDGGGSLFVYPAYFPYYSGSWFELEQPQADVHGAPDTLMSGIELSVGGPGADPGQYLPDTVTIADSLVAEAAMFWDDGGIAALFSGGCRPHRLIWTGFGLEGVGPPAERVEALEKMLEWLELPPPAVDLRFPLLSDPAIDEAGETVTRTVRVENAGTLTTTFVFSLSGNFWPSILKFPDGSSTTDAKPFTLPGCGGANLISRVTIPDGLPRDVFDRLTISAAPQDDPDAFLSTTLTTKTPAPLLLLDDGLFIWYGDRYAEALDRLGIPFDFVSTKGQVLEENILPRYPVVIWTTGWDWFLSLPEVEQEMMISYLDGGGRLLLSSQDILNRVQNPALTRDYLGISRASHEVTPTVALAVPGDFLGLNTAAWRLDYPLVNWSDGLYPAPGAVPLLFDQNLNTLGAANLPAASPEARTLFYAFPIETLPSDALDDILRAATLWLGPFGGTALDIPEVVPSGERFDLALQLVSAERSTLENVALRLALPTGVYVASDSVVGPWWYDPSERTLVWDGSLAGGSVLDLAAGIEVEAGASGNLLAFTGLLLTADGQVYRFERRAVVDGPYVTVEKSYSPGIVTFDANRVDAAITVKNGGFVQAGAVLTDTIPVGLALVPGTLTASSGVVKFEEVFIYWTGTVDPEIPVVISYVLEADFPQIPGLRVGYVEVWDGLAHRGAWGVVEIAGTLYFPFLDR